MWSSSRCALAFNGYPGSGQRRVAKNCRQAAVPILDVSLNFQNSAILRPHLPQYLARSLAANRPPYAPTRPYLPRRPTLGWVYLEMMEIAHGWVRAWSSLRLRGLMNHSTGTTTRSRRVLQRHPQQPGLTPNTLAQTSPVLTS